MLARCAHAVCTVRRRTPSRSRSTCVRLSPHVYPHKGGRGRGRGEGGEQEDADEGGRGEQQEEDELEYGLLKNTACLVNILKNAFVGGG